MLRMAAPFKSLALTSSLQRANSRHMAITSLSPQQLRNAADLKERIDALQEQLEEILGGTTAYAAQTAPMAGVPKKRRMSAAGRAAISAAAKPSWEKFRGEARNPSNGAQKTKRNMSPAARARLSALAKARWKKARASGKSTL